MSSGETTPASTGWRALPRSPLPRKLRKAHEEFVDRAGALPALADRPDDERLASAGVAGGEYLRRAGDVGTLSVGRRLGVAARVLFHAELAEHRLQRRNEAHRQQHQVGRDDGLRPRHLAGLAVLPFQPHGPPRLHLALLADELLGADGPIPVHAFLVGGRRAQARGPIRPHRVPLHIGRHGQQFELYDRPGAMAVRGADTVRAGVAAADDHHVLVRGPQVLHVLVARHALVLQRQEVHGEVHAVKLASGDRQVARLLGAAGQHDGVVVGQQLLGRNAAFRIAADAAPGRLAADEHAGAELDAFLAHLLQAPVDDALFQLEIGNAVAQQAADAVALFEHGDLVAGARKLLGAGEARRTRADHGDFLAALVGRGL